MGEKWVRLSKVEKLIKHKLPDQRRKRRYLIRNTRKISNEDVGEIDGEVLKFARNMQRVKDNYGDEMNESWKEFSMEILDEGLREEFLEDWQEQFYPRNPFERTEKDDKKEKKELLDIANYCMMLWNRLDRKEKLNELIDR